MPQWDGLFACAYQLRKEMCCCSLLPLREIAKFQNQLRYPSSIPGVSRATGICCSSSDSSSSESSRIGDNSSSSSKNSDSSNSSKKGECGSRSEVSICRKRQRAVSNSSSCNSCCSMVHRQGDGVEACTQRESGSIRSVIRYGSSVREAESSDFCSNGQSGSSGRPNECNSSRHNAERNGIHGTRCTPDIISGWSGSRSISPTKHLLRQAAAGVKALHAEPLAPAAGVAAAAEVTTAAGARVAVGVTTAAGLTAAGVTTRTDIAGGEAESAESLAQAGAAAVPAEGERKSISCFMRRRRWKAEKAVLRYLLGMPSCSGAGNRRMQRNRSKREPASRDAVDSDRRGQCGVDSSSKGCSVSDRNAHNSSAGFMRSGRSSSSSSNMSHSSCMSNSNSSRRSRVASCTCNNDTRRRFERSCSKWGDSSRCRDSSSNWIANSLFRSSPVSGIDGDTSVPLHPRSSKDAAAFLKEEGDRKEECVEETKGGYKEEEDVECTSFGIASSSSLRQELGHDTALPDCSSFGARASYASTCSNGSSSVNPECANNGTSVLTARDLGWQHQAVSAFAESKASLTAGAMRPAATSERTAAECGGPTAAAASISDATAVEKIAKTHFLSEGEGDRARRFIRREAHLTSPLWRGTSDEEDALLLDLCCRWKVLKRPAVSFFWSHGSRRPAPAHLLSKLIPKHSPGVSQLRQRSLRLRHCFHLGAWCRALQKEGFYQQQQDFNATTTLAVLAAAATPCGAAAAAHASKGSVAGWRFVSTAADGSPAEAADAARIQTSAAAGIRRTAVARTDAATAAAVWGTSPKENNFEGKSPEKATTAAATSMAPFAAATASLSTVTGLAQSEEIQFVGRRATLKVNAPAAASVKRKRKILSDAVICVTDNEDGRGGDNNAGLNEFTSVQRRERFSTSFSSKRQQTRSVEPLGETAVVDLHHDDKDTEKVHLEGREKAEVQEVAETAAREEDQDINKRFREGSQRVRWQSLHDERRGGFVTGWWGEAAATAGIAAAAGLAAPAALAAEDENRDVGACRTVRRTAPEAIKYSTVIESADGDLQEVGHLGTGESAATPRHVANQKHQAPTNRQLESDVEKVLFVEEESRRTTTSEQVSDACPAVHSVVDDVQGKEEEMKLSIQRNVRHSVSGAQQNMRARTTRWRRVGGEYDIWLILDVRERVTAPRRYTAGADSTTSSRGQYLFEQLQQNGVNVELRSLPVGDALWVARRKSQISVEHEQRHPQQQQEKPQPPQLQRQHCTWQSRRKGESYDKDKVLVNEKMKPRDAHDKQETETSIGAAAPVSSSAIQLPSAARNNEDSLRFCSASTETLGRAAAPRLQSSSSSFPVEYVLPFILERKTLRDLTASLRDGRYEEQKFRLLRCPGIKRIFYLVEGLLESSSYDAIPILPLQKRHFSFLYSRPPAAVGESGANVAQAEDTDSLRRRQQALHARAHALHRVRGAQTLTQQERTSHSGGTQCLSSQQQQHRQEVVHRFAGREASQPFSFSAAAVASEIAAIRTAQVKTQLINGFTLLQTTGPAHTVAMLTRLHRRLKVHFACTAAEKRQPQLWLGETDRLDRSAHTHMTDKSHSSRRCARPPGYSITLLATRVSADCLKHHKRSCTSAAALKKTSIACTRQRLHRETGKGLYFSISNTTTISPADCIRVTQRRKRLLERCSHTLDTSNLFLVPSNELASMTQTSDPSRCIASRCSRSPAFFFLGGASRRAEDGGALELLRWDTWRTRSGKAMNLTVKEIFCRQLRALPSMGHRGAAYLAETCCNPAAFASVLDSTTSEKQLREHLAATAAAIKQTTVRKHLALHAGHPPNTAANHLSTPLRGSSQERNNEEGVVSNANLQLRVPANTISGAAQDDGSERDRTVLQKSREDPCGEVSGHCLRIACVKSLETPETILTHEGRPSCELGTKVFDKASLERSMRTRERQQRRSALTGQKTENVNSCFSAPISAKAWALCRVMYQQLPPESALSTVRAAFLANHPQMPQAAD